MNSIMKLAVWIAGALAFGWLATAASFAYPGGHPPLWYFVGGGVVLASFVIAPIGAAAALSELWRARAPRMAVAALGLNLLFLVMAVGLWCWFRWEASRR